MTPKESTEEPDMKFVRAVAQLIRTNYIKQKTQLIGPSYKLSGRHDTAGIWQKAAKQCLDLQAEPVEYVKACFLNCRNTNGPFPNQMGGVSSALWYKQYIRRVVDVDVVAQPGENLVEAALRQDMEVKIVEVRKIMKNLHGTFAPTKENLDWLCMRTSRIEPHVRVLLAYPDVRIRKECGCEARNIFLTNPKIFKAAKSLGYPMDIIINWLDSN